MNQPADAASNPTSTVVLTGATGFLGTQLARELSAQGKTILAVVRPQGNMGARQRLERLWHEHPELVDSLASGRIVPLVGQITEPRFGLSEEDAQLVLSCADAVIHAAADVNINQTIDALRQSNVEATRNALEIARAICSRRPLQRFAFVSTAYVAGKREGTILEDELIDCGFNSLYEQTKFEAEQLVRDAACDLPISIFRPAQIVGHSQTGWITAFNTVYYPLKMYLLGKLRVLPISPEQRLNIVPVDYVTRTIIAALDAPDAAGRTFHCTLPYSLQPTVRELVSEVRAWAAHELGIRYPAPLYAPLPLASTLGGMRNLRQSSGVKRKSFARNMLALAPYFDDGHVFDTTNTLKLLGPCRLSWRSFLPSMLHYAVSRGFLKHTGRTAFEQMQVCLASKRASLDYFDVSAHGIRKMTAGQMAEQVRHIAAALREVGLEPGDRIALAGVNSTAYASVDAAIGLIGAVSVPLYYTSPFADIRELATRSHAKLLFLGTPSLLQAFAESDFALPCVAMPLASENCPEDERITPWDVFLGIGRAHPEELDRLAPANLDDVATIRYTSGTTGLPKGTTFTHAQLAWMGRTMPAILDWKTRNAPMRYLSFLPMSHVVEGILVAYAAYYLLTDVEFYCLNDFGQLTDALPKVRPTIFFSVPRFYEKVWSQFEASGAGARYLSMPDGPAKRAFGRVCGRVVLRKAGLDACRQLIVGSAPIRLELLEAYRGLGIEIHNAFGLTEAPLITLNRLGRNDLGSLGQPLPETEVKIDGEGQIWMRGPQLTPGYDGLGALPTDDDGFFATGDLGRYSPAGNLVIDGRIKELVITAYGKNVQSEKLEALAKGITGVSEAMLVGDGRPYCTALVWLEEEAAASFDAATFDAAMRELNGRVSHPEMLKRWAVMRKPLSLAEGELTPNLKLRRAEILKHNPQVVEALYADELPACPPAALHLGAQDR